MRLLICMNLNITGYEIVSMPDGQAVLDYLAEGGSADLAVVDVMMPRVDGFALLPVLQEKKMEDTCTLQAFDGELVIC